MSVFETPLGPLSSLNLDSADTCMDVLSMDKHQIAEGMVVESLFDQIVKRIPPQVGGAVHVLDVETFVASGKGSMYAFVWWREAGLGLGRYLKALENKFTVFGVRLDPQNSCFEVCSISGGKRSSMWEPLHDFLAQMGLKKQEPYVVSDDVRDRKRQLSAFWGYLMQTHGARLKERVALPRILVNWGIQPWFKHVWNIDRVMVEGNRIWVLEVKHKYPFRRDGALFFGLNNGEARLLDLLHQCGISCVHAVVVKPSWGKDAGSMYLINDYEAKRRAMLVGLVVDERCVDQIRAASTGRSGAYTSVTGSSQLTYKFLPVTWFTPLASLADPDASALRLVALMRGCLTDRCSEKLLGDLRMTAHRAL